MRFHFHVLVLFLLAAFLSIPISALPTSLTTDLSPGAAISASTSIPSSISDALQHLKINGMIPPSFTPPTNTDVTAGTNAAAIQCGHLSIIEGGFFVPMYTSNMCTNSDAFEHFKYVENWACGLCMVFHGQGCQGDVRYWGGPENHPHRSHDVTGAESYWCF